MLNDTENTVHEITAESYPEVWELLQATAEEIISDDLPSRVMCDRCTAELHQSDSAIADLHFDLKCLESGTDSRLATLKDQVDYSEWAIAALQFNFETLKEEVGTLNDILDSDSTQAIRITARRYRLAEFMRYMALTAIGFAAILTIGAAISGSQSQKDEFAQLAVVTGLGAVLGMAIGYSTSED